MSNIPTTRASLLIRIRDWNDSEAWQQFDVLYGPLIFWYGRKHGLQEADAADFRQIVMEVLGRSAESLDYDPAKGKFRNWLLTVIQRHLSKFRHKSGRAVHGSGDDDVHEMLNEHVDEADDAEQWELEYQRQRFQWACDRVRPAVDEKTWQAFWLSAVENKPVSEVAEELSMTAGAIYTSKSRVLSRIREEIEALNDE